MSRTAADDIALSDPSFWQRADRDDGFALLRRDRPVSWQEEPPTIWSPAGRGYWAVTTHRDVRSASRGPDVFASGQATELFDLPLDVARTYSGMLNMDAPEHTRMRAIGRFIAAFAEGPTEESVRRSCAGAGLRRRLYSAAKGRL